jgi:hypothetical protein
MITGCVSTGLSVSLTILWKVGARPDNHSGMRI